MVPIRHLVTTAFKHLHSRPLRRRWAMLLVMSVAAAGLEAVAAGAVFSLIGIIANPAIAAKIPVLGQWLVQSMAENRDITTIVMAAGTSALFVGKNAFQLYQIYALERCGFESTAHMAEWLFGGFLRAPYSRHFGRNSAELIQTIQFIVDDVYRIILSSTVGLVSEAMIGLAIATILFLAQPVMTLGVIVVMGGLMAVIIRVTHGRLTDLGGRAAKLQPEVLKSIRQALGAVKELKVLGREQTFLDAFSHNYRQRIRCQYTATTIQQAPRLIMEALMVVTMVMVILWTLLSKADAVTVIPTLGLYAYAAFRIQPSVNRILLNLANIRKSAITVGMLEREIALFCTEVDAPHRPDAPPIVFTRALSLENVVCTYPGRDAPALKGLSLALPFGRSLGIAGPTGSGKSTLVDVILGLLPPDSGQVTVDGSDIRANLRDWQSRIGYVPQTIYLTDDTLRRNVAFGIPESDINEDWLRDAIAMAQLDDVVAGLPDGIHSRVGEHGVSLSGGQRQRIGIARALYHRPHLLIFDEATSALDAETEHEVSLAIDRLSGTKTIILIAHRLATLKHCDEILFLKDGLIAGRGRADELVRDNKDFARMAALAVLPGAERQEV